jgi:hypothetical protein
LHVADAFRSGRMTGRGFSPGHKKVRGGESFGDPMMSGEACRMVATE